ncbi:MAG: hypothetical protein K2Q21_15770 [Chitinophagaceae bacterium]|nr:hypothetical protein [Chitinophagaceae bacterium]
MKTIYATLLLLICFNACVLPNQKNASVMIDTAIYKVDTIINPILIDSVRFQAAVLRDRWNSQHQQFKDSNQSPVTLIVFSEKEVLLKQKFSAAENDLPFWYHKLFKYHQKATDSIGRLFFAATSYFGGSSSVTSVFLIRRAGSKLFADSVFKTSGELSYELADSSGNKILLIEGLWNMSENETHFSDHQLRLTVFDCSVIPIAKSIPLTTKNKYTLPDDDASANILLQQIRKTEPDISKSLLF